MIRYVLSLNIIKSSIRGLMSSQDILCRSRKRGGEREDREKKRGISWFPFDFLFSFIFTLPNLNKSIRWVPSGILTQILSFFI